MVSKYRNVKTTVNGHTFDSKREARRYQELCLLVHANKIRDLVLQPRIKIEIGGVPVRFDSGRQVTYIADFQYFDVDAGRGVIEDAKGYRTRDYKLKRAMLRAMGLEIVET